MQTSRFQLGLIATLAVGAGDTLAAIAFVGHIRGASFVDGARRGIVAASLRISSASFPPEDLLADIDRLVAQLPAPTTDH